jgi:hypothetical protein
MSIVAGVTFFFMSILNLFKGEANDPVTLKNSLSRFQHLYYDLNKDINVASKLNAYVEAVILLDDQHPLQLLEVGKESHCLAFNYFLYLIRREKFPFRASENFAENCLKSFKMSGEFVASSTVRNVIIEAIEIFKNLELKDQCKNEESFKIVNHLAMIASEFANKIQDLKDRESKLSACRYITFISENLAIDYQNGTIDYGAFMAVFYEIKSLYLSKSKGEHLRKRLKNLKVLFKAYAFLIIKSHCYLIFDFNPAEELFYLITWNEYHGKKRSFKKIFLGPNKKRIALERLYDQYQYLSVYLKLDELVLGGDYVSSKQLIKRRFFTKLFNLLNVKEDFDYFWNSSRAEYLSDYNLWIYAGLSKIEYYLNSSKILK